MKSRVVPALIPLVLWACASLPREIAFVPDDGFELSIAADARSQVFRVALESRSTEAICLDVGQWPNNLGQLHMGSDLAQVIVGERSFPAEDGNFGYCVGPRCVIRIAPRQRLDGHIAFSEFRGWDQVTDRARLNYRVQPWYCEAREGHRRGGAG